MDTKKDTLIETMDRRYRIKEHVLTITHYTILDDDLGKRWIAHGTVDGQHTDGFCHPSLEQSVVGLIELVSSDVDNGFYQAD